MKIIFHSNALSNINCIKPSIVLGLLVLTYPGKIINWSDCQSYVTKHTLGALFIEQSVGSVVVFNISAFHQEIETHTSWSVFVRQSNSTNMIRSLMKFCSFFFVLIWMCIWLSNKCAPQTLWLCFQLSKYRLLTIIICDFFPWHFPNNL